MMWGVLEAAGNPNAYDITTWDPNVDQVTFTSEAFYNRIDVRKALHAPMNITWHGCADGNGRRRRRRRSLQGISRNPEDMFAMGEDLFHRKLYLENDRPIDVVPYVGDLLDADIPVLVYNGDRDMTTNAVGRDQPTELVSMKQSVKPPEGMEDEHDEDWWQFEIGRLMGAEKATEQEDNRLLAANLSRLMAEQTDMLQ